jgi:hypothetical protein
MGITSRVLHQRIICIRRDHVRAVAVIYFLPLANWDGLKIRMTTYARRLQVLDLYNIAAATFPGQNAAHERGYEYLIPLMPHRIRGGAMDKPAVTP